MQNYNSKFKINLKDRCYQFSLDTINFINTLPNKRAAWIIADQLLRSAMSIGANLIEGSAASSMDITSRNRTKLADGLAILGGLEQKICKA
ncbi:MAG: hypothetical protein A3D44_00135 [Candidatus Staskawiczbacteria bacterium RIFCSPHIGHO2_02_FULL_42_22]|uniref:Four helix bundle protein n=1 Tax=Candidatus Staskawiczbacteria bacterium RIFCSPHIGHO2_02_FULL_42_22 TaxID=1802207 RepID=A0A1G2HZD6_9BACT|nr:MAG: hypothetical protein A3D44_00135 [Candidatus Staskawiczbacteria bacterium RIFCSPHIGHO2_02_FULL_42_22]